MKMRKITAAVLAGVMIVLSGCGGNEETGEVSSVPEDSAAESVAADLEVVTSEENISEEVRESETTVLEDTVSAITSVAEESKKTSSVSLAEVPERETEQMSADYTGKAFNLEHDLQRLMYELKDELYTSLWSVTYGAMDFNKDGAEELFAVFSRDGQGFCDIAFYSTDDDDFGEELFRVSGFSRDGTTYFKYDNDNERLLVFSEFTHMYSWKEQKIQAVYSDGRVDELFSAAWSSDSVYDPFVTVRASVDSEEATEAEYQNALEEFLSFEYEDIIYIYDYALYSGSELINENNFNKYYFEKESMNYDN